MHAPAVRALRRRGEGDPIDARDLSRHDVHDDARGVHGLAAGNVESDARDGLPPLRDAGARTELGHDGRRHLRVRGRPHAHDRLFQCEAHRRVECGESFIEVRLGHADIVARHAVEPLGLRPQGALALRGHIGDELGGGGERLVARRRGARDDSKQFRGRERAPAQIDGAQDSQPRVTPSTSSR